jgi:hypothetical protein
MIKRLFGYFFPKKSPDFYIPATRRHLAMKQRGPEEILETSMYDPKDDAWYVQSYERFRSKEEYSSNEIAAWSYLPIRKLATVTEKEKN